LLNAAEAHGAVFSPWRPVSFSDNPAAGDRVRDLIAPVADAHSATPEQMALASEEIDLLSMHWIHPNG
jgi:pyridoxine 4-dehydrogenase